METSECIENIGTGTGTVEVRHELHVPKGIHKIKWILVGIMTRIQTAACPIQVQFEIQRNGEMLARFRTQKINWYYDQDMPLDYKVPIAKWRMVDQEIDVFEGETLSVIAHNIEHPVCAPTCELEVCYVS